MHTDGHPHVMGLGRGRHDKNNQTLPPSQPPFLCPSPSAQKETLIISKRKMNNLPSLKILGKTHTCDELFTKPNPKNEREKHRKMNRTEDQAEGG